MQILVLNAGSSSLKHRLYAPINGDLTSLTQGLIERIGEPQGEVPSHADAFAQLFSQLGRSDLFDSRRLVGIGHRIVHGTPSIDRC